MLISKETILNGLTGFVDNLFRLPEIRRIRIRDVILQRDEERGEKLRLAVDKSYHDAMSDVDLSATVAFLPGESVSPAEYLKCAERFGVNEQSCLGFSFEGQNLLRIIFKDGRRYDLAFEFEFDAQAKPVKVCPHRVTNGNPDWSMEQVNRFWFVQIQALGKLYRKDFLISSHLANMNLNETLVQQMVLRDIEYGTNHHRYGYEEALAYLKYKGMCPLRTGNETFDLIADKLYCAAMTYDELTKSFYPEYTERLPDFMQIWNCYEENRMDQ